MLLTIERVLVLKGLSFFAECTDDVLADLACLMEEVRADAGRQIIAQGDRGEAMFIIVQGRVRVHVDDKTLIELGERQVFGELAALDPEPRTASVTATTDTHLLKLEHAPLFEFIEHSSDATRSIVRFLCQRFRTKDDES